MASEFVPVALAQLWQVTLLILAVATLNRWFMKRQPHLSHLLWLVVLIKCVTPPLWASPGGLFCWLQPELQVESVVVGTSELPVVAWQEMLETDTRVVFDADVSLNRFAGVILDEDVAEEILKLESDAVFPAAEPPPSRFGQTACVIWLMMTLLVLLGVTVRWLRFWRLVQSSPRRESPELVSLLDSLTRQLHVRRRVRLIVTESLVGPAVIGFFRVTVLIPAVVADRLQGKAVAPILAHELLHIRRGDLWVGLLQTLAQAMWWFYPLVWWVGRVTTREAERCCDEEVLGELKCDPASYARVLLDVLDLKSQLRPVPVFPGVRPVDVTSQRLERIMSLRQGCRRRSPWWCWLVAIGAAALALPGAAFVVTAQDEESNSPPAGEAAQVYPAPPAFVGSGPVYSNPQKAELAAYSIVSNNGTLTTQVYDVTEFSQLLSGTDAEKQQKFEWLVRSRDAARELQINWFNGQPVIKTTVAGHESVRECIGIFLSSGATPQTIEAFLNSVAKQPEATLVCELQLISASDDAYSKLEDVALEHSDSLPWVIPFAQWEQAVQSIERDELYFFGTPRCAAINGHSVMMESVAEHPVSLKRDDDGSLHVGRNWSGWKTSMLPFLRDDDSFWLGMRFEHGTVVGKKTLSDDEAKQIGAEGSATIHSYRTLNFATTLKAGQVFVLPGFEINHGNSPAKSTLLTVRVRRHADHQTPDIAALPQQVIGTGVTSDAGLSGTVTLTSGGPDSAESAVKKTQDEREPASQRKAAASAASLHAGRLFFKHGGCRLEAVPGKGAQLDAAIDSGGLTIFRSPLTLMLTRTEGLDVGHALVMQAEQCRISQGDSLTVELSGNVVLSAPRQLMEAKADYLQMTIQPVGNAKSESGIQFRLKNVAMTIQMDPAKDSSLLQAEEISVALDIDTFKVAELTASKVESLQVSDTKRQAAARNSLSPAFYRDRQLSSQWDTIRSRHSLQKLVSPTFDRTPLKEAVAWFRTAGDVNIVIDESAIEEEGISVTTPVTQELNEVAIHSALRLLLEPLNLAVKIDEDSGVLIVTSKLRIQGKMIAAAYPVANLVVPIPVHVTIHAEVNGTVRAGSSEALSQVTEKNHRPHEWQRVETLLPASEKTTPFDFGKLTELIQQTIHPDSWQEVGGMGTLRANETTLSLVIRQTQDVHREISDLLDQLRRLQELQVAVRGEVLNLSEQSLGDLKFETMGESPEHRFAILSKEQVAELRKVGRTRPLPVFTLFNGQKCDVLFGGKPNEHGRLSLQPAASADRSVIRLALRCQPQITGNVGAALSSLPPLSSGTPVLLDVMDTLQAGDSNADGRALLLVTSEILIVQEEELLGIDNNALAR